MAFATSVRGLDCQSLRVGPKRGTSKKHQRQRVLDGINRALPRKKIKRVARQQARNAEGGPRAPLSREPSDRQTAARGWRCDCAGGGGSVAHPLANGTALVRRGRPD